MKCGDNDETDCAIWYCQKNVIYRSIIRGIIDIHCIALKAISWYPCARKMMRRVYYHDETSEIAVPISCSRIRIIGGGGEVLNT